MRHYLLYKFELSARTHAAFLTNQIQGLFQYGSGDARAHWASQTKESVQIHQTLLESAYATVFVAWEGGGRDMPQEPVEKTLEETNLLYYIAKNSHWTKFHLQPNYMYYQGSPQDNLSSG